MRKTMNYFSRKLREALYLLLSLPVSVVLFAIVLIGLNSATFIPVAILIFLFVLTLMERIARVEIWRTNKILKTDLHPVPNWFREPFFSWNGAKERITSLRSWMAILYVFAAFGISVVAFTVTVFGITGIVAILITIGAFTLSTFDRSYQFINEVSDTPGSVEFSFFGNNGVLQWDLGDGSSSGVLNFDVGSWWSWGIGLVLILLALWSIPRIARLMAAMVEGFLAGGFYQKFEDGVRSLQKRRKVDTEKVRDAIADEVARPELSLLSRREREILALMAEGKSNSGIAKQLYITEGSVEKHVSSILSKLGIIIEEENHRRVLAVLTYLGIEKEH